MPDMRVKATSNPWVSGGRGLSVLSPLLFGVLSPLLSFADYGPRQMLRIVDVCAQTERQLKLAVWLWV